MMSSTEIVALIWGQCPVFTGRALLTSRQEGIQTQKENTGLSIYGSMFVPNDNSIHSPIHAIYV